MQQWKKKKALQTKKTSKRGHIVLPKIGSSFAHGCSCLVGRTWTRSAKALNKALFLLERLSTEQWRGMLQDLLRVYCTTRITDTLPFKQKSWIESVKKEKQHQMDHEYAFSHNLISEKKTLVLDAIRPDSTDKREKRQEKRHRYLL